MKVRFKHCRVLVDFRDREKLTIYPTVAVDAGTVLDVEQRTCTCRDKSCYDYIFIEGTDFGIDKPTFDHWIERGRVEKL